MNDVIKCGWCFSRIFPSFLCPPCEKQLIWGELHSSNHLLRRGLYLFIGTAPVSHTCMIPLECLETSFSQRSMYTCVLGHLFVIYPFPDQVCGSQRQGLACKCGQHGENTNRDKVVPLPTYIRRI